LDAELAVKIQKYFEGRIKVAFGIGTNLTNDCGLKPLNMVIKASAFKVNGRWVSVVKLSDTPGKHSGSAKDVALVQGALGLAVDSLKPSEKRDARYAAKSDAELMADFARYDAFVKIAYNSSSREAEIVLKANSLTSTWREILRRGLMKEEDYKCL
jgi:nicotinic acid phosphoribosyltransferase